MQRAIHFLTRLSLATVCALSLNLSAMASPEGQWNGSIQLPGLELRVTVTLQLIEGQWTGSIDIPQQKAKDLPLTDIQVTAEQVSFKIKGIPGDPTFSAQLYEDETRLTGTFSQGGQTFPVALDKPDSAHAKVAQAEQAKSLQKWKDWLSKEMQKIGTPGLAVAIVQDDTVIFAEGLGFRDREAQKPVTEDTLFAIGSSTKAFTASLIGMLVDERKLEWDQPVRKILPDFQLYDDYASAHLTTRDLLIHDSGLPRHDLSWYSSYASRDELYKRLRYLEPSAELRQQFQYQNLMYMTAGILAEKASGFSWEDLVQERIFSPLKMTRSTTSGPLARQKGDYARPYRLHNGTVSLIPPRDIASMGPAGSIHSSIKDMAQWLRFNLGDGHFENKTILSSDSLKQLQSPQIVMASQGQSPMIPYMLYGMGWMIHPYRGHTLIQHGGNIDGFTAQVGLLPEKNLGIVILSNQDSDPLPSIALFSLLDEMLKLEPVDWSQRIDSFMDAIAHRPVAADDEVKIQHTQPSHKLQDYTGSYAYPGYDDLLVTMDGQNLKLRYGKSTQTVKHWHYDTFRTSGDESVLNGLYLQFENNLLGEIETVKVQLEPNIEPLSFTRQTEAIYLKEDYLKQFEGHYLLQKLPLSLKMVSKHLIAQVPGQKDQELVPTGKNKFRLKAEKGYYIQFIVKNNTVEKAIIIQPGGQFEAIRKD